MNKFKKIILLMACMFYMSSINTMKKNNNLSSTSTLKKSLIVTIATIGLAAIVNGGIEINSAVNLANWDGETSNSSQHFPFYRLQPTIGVLKVAVGSVLTFFSLTSLISDKKHNNKKKH